MSITAIVENDTVKLPMHVPDGTKVEITLPENSGPKRWMELAGCLAMEAKELRRIGAVIDDEFERTNPEDWR